VHGAAGDAADLLAHALSCSRAGEFEYLDTSVAEVQHLRRSPLTTGDLVEVGGNAVSRALQLVDAAS
jgi:hypothetical protein